MLDIGYNYLVFDKISSAELYFCKDDMDLGPIRKKSYEEIYYHVYLYEEFQNNVFVRKKVRFEELATRNVLFTDSTLFWRDEHKYT